MPFQVAHTFGDLDLLVIDSSSISFHVIYSGLSHDRRIEFFLSRRQRTWISSWNGGNSLVGTNVGIYLIIVLGLFYFLLVLWIWCLVYRLDRLVVSIKVLSVWGFSEVAWHLLELLDLTLLESWRFSYNWALCKLLDERGLEVWIDDESIFYASAVFDVSSSAVFAAFAVHASSALFAVGKWRHFLRDWRSDTSTIFFLIFCIFSIDLIDILHKLPWFYVRLFDF